jgi:hypothetical protein
MAKRTVYSITAAICPALRCSHGRALLKLQDATVRPSTAGRYHSFMRSGVAYPQRQSQGHSEAEGA